MIVTDSKPKNQTLEAVIIRFVGDSGDGMQLTGTQFSDTSAMFGNDIATFPNYPAEIRAPQGSLYGVSGFQVHIVADAVASRANENRDIAIDLLKQAGAVITSTEIVIFQWALRANTADFRKILHIVK